MSKKKYKIGIKIGDNVKIISGYSKGKTGKVKQIFPKENKVIIEDTNFITKHVRPKKEGDTGQIIKIECPIHISNVKLYTKKV
uniref:Large ribosomal subunit protein uL24c n=1 Tax=Schizymenia dubyi TaxID=38368 RepID=A0A1C9C9K8_9FLOR|nr:ribosomal protein L24 [Schizymenia dubyi]AOM65076.1 ribosomal protein L24 [Schizymenia dubyi]